MFGCGYLTPHKLVIFALACADWGAYSERDYCPFIVTGQRFSNVEEEQHHASDVSERSSSWCALVAVPSIAFAQASIVGTVKDASGAVLPGVTVEASSPALIEKTRTVVTNGAGQYSIENLRPGTYTVTFTLTGFATVKREGIELTGSFIGDRERRHESRSGVGNGHGQRRSAGGRRDERAQPADDQRQDGQRNPDVPAVLAASSRSSRRSTFRATTSAAPRVASSTCSRSTADAGTKGRSRSMA